MRGYPPLGKVFLSISGLISGCGAGLGAPSELASKVG